MRKPITRAISNRRLLKLAAFLETVPRERFNYGHWVGENWRGAPDLSCGTTACALGWATVMPEFRRLGLYLSPRTRTPRIKGARAPYWEDTSTVAITRLFGNFGVISDEPLQYISSRFSNPIVDLFYPDYSGAGVDRDATPKQVARRIRDFVKDHPA